MAKIGLYIRNLSIALARIPKAILGLYKYHPDDSYIKNILVVVDCFGNTVTLGDPDETISSRSGKAEHWEITQNQWGWGCRMCSFLAVFQKDHCAKALNRLKGRRAVIADE